MFQGEKSTLTRKMERMVYIPHLLIDSTHGPLAVCKLCEWDWHCASVFREQTWTMTDALLFQIQSSTGWAFRKLDKQVMYLIAIVIYDFGLEVNFPWP